MYKGMKIAVVIPARNEEKHLPNVLATIPDFVDEVVVIDDGSTDKTPELVGDASFCLLYTSPSPRDVEESRMPSSA